jgi:hypothetical protein
MGSGDRGVTRWLTRMPRHRAGDPPTYFWKNKKTRHNFLFHCLRHSTCQKSCAIQYQDDLRGHGGA